MRESTQLLEDQGRAACAIHDPRIECRDPEGGAQANDVIEEPKAHARGVHRQEGPCIKKFGQHKDGEVDSLSAVPGVEDRQYHQAAALWPGSRDRRPGTAVSGIRTKEQRAKELEPKEGSHPRLRGRDAG